MVNNAVLWAILLLRPYLEPSWLIISTDDENLKWLLISVDTSAKLATWRLRILECDLEMVHRTVVKDEAPKPLSRLEKEGTVKTSLYNNYQSL